MSMILKMFGEPGYLHVGAKGEFSLPEAQRTFVEMLEAVAQHSVDKVLFDGRGLSGNPESMERFFYGQFAAEQVAQFGDRGVSPSTRFAYVLEVPMRDPARFGENVARNRGMDVTTFDNLKDAFGWLGIAPVDNPDPGNGK